MGSLNVGLLTCRFTGKEVINILGDKLDCIITLPHTNDTTQKIDGYYGFNSCDIPVYNLNKYNMSCEEDLNLIKSLKLDLLFVLDWQRILPEEVLNSVKYGVIGVHSPSKLLPYGKGRSPINWSIIQGKKQIFIHVFKYNAGVDSGDIIDIVPIDITEHDDIYSLYLKQAFYASLVFDDIIENVSWDGELLCKPQSLDGETFYPKRTPDDGEIMWSDSCTDICNFIKGIGYPFSGAYSCIDEKNKIYIEKAVPFSNGVRYKSTEIVGEIMYIFSDNSFLVSTGTVPLWVQEYNSNFNLRKHIGDRFLLPKRKGWMLPE